MPVMLLLLAAVSGPASSPVGRGACTAAVDCQLAGECTAGKCVCASPLPPAARLSSHFVAAAADEPSERRACAGDPGWAGALCSQLDLEPLTEEPAAWNSEYSPRSSWGAAPFKAADGKFHGWFNQLPDQCGLSSWLPGSYIEHGIADHPLGPFKLAPGSGIAPKTPPPPGAKRNPLSQYATNPHITYVAKEKTWLIYYNGREWAPNDLTKCAPNKTGIAPWHGGGSCAKDTDCPGFGYKPHHSQNPGKCIGGKCVCEHHSTGLHCTGITETVNVASATSVDGPWTQLLPDGSPFWSGPGGGNDSLALSNPSAVALANGTIVLAYSRADPNGGTGISTAPHWKGPYTRLFLPTKVSSHAPLGRNFSLVRCGEDPFIYQDFRGTWRVLCHGGTEKAGWSTQFPDAKIETIGMAFSTDLIHWTAGPNPAATSLMTYANGTVRPFARRERPSLLLDEKGFPLVM